MSMAMHSFDASAVTRAIDAPIPVVEELSPQERRVVALFALDYTNKQVARALEIHPETVKTYARRIYAKLGVRTKAGCVAAALTRGRA
jgi:DNA-binding CsgD family transcriptional regulator